MEAVSSPPVHSLVALLGLTVLAQIEVGVGQVHVGSPQRRHITEWGNSLQPLHMKGGTEARGYCWTGVTEADTARVVLTFE